jgi:hypothetical protein
VSLGLAPSQKEVEFRVYETIAILMRPLEVYSQVLVTFAPEPRKLRLAAALTVYRHRLYEFSQTHTWDSIKLSSHGLPSQEDPQWALYPGRLEQRGPRP